MKLSEKYPKDYIPTKVSVPDTQQLKGKGKGLRTKSKKDNVEGTGSKGVEHGEKSNVLELQLTDQGEIVEVNSNLVQQVNNGEGSGIILQTGQSGGAPGTGLILQNQSTNITAQYAGNDVYSLQLPTQNIVHLQQQQGGSVTSLQPVPQQQQQGTFNVIGELQQITGVQNYALYHPAQIVLATPQQQGQSNETVMLNVGLNQV